MNLVPRLLAFPMSKRQEALGMRLHQYNSVVYIFSTNKYRTHVLRFINKNANNKKTIILLTSLFSTVLLITMHNMNLKIYSFRQNKLNMNKNRFLCEKEQDALIYNVLHLWNILSNSSIYLNYSSIYCIAF